MAKNSGRAAVAIADPVDGESKNPARTEPINLDPQNSMALAAAFDVCYHLFGARVEKWNVTEDGIYAVGFSVEGEYPVEEILTFLGNRVRRPQLWPTIKWLNGMAPDEFENSAAVTVAMVQFFKGADNSSSKVPQFVRTAAQKYRLARGESFARPRGRQKTPTLNLKNVSQIGPEAFAGLTPEQIQHLATIANAALSERNGEAVGASES